MEKSQPFEWPYYFCPTCSCLAPVHVMSGTKFCIVCAYTYEDDEGGRLVLLSQREARLRRLVVIKDESGEIEE